MFGWLLAQLVQVFLQCGSLIWTFSKVVPGDRVGLRNSESETRAPPRYVLEYLRCYEQWQGEADVRAMQGNTRTSRDAGEREGRSKSGQICAFIEKQKATCLRAKKGKIRVMTPCFQYRERGVDQRWRRETGRA